MKKIIIFFVFLLGCSGVKQQIESGHEDFFERDAKICVNDQCDVGYLVVPPAEEYEIEIENPSGDHDYLIMETCHNFLKFQDEGSHHKFKYKPDEHFETKGKCVMIFSSYDKENRDSFAFVAIDDPYYKFHAKTRCANHGLKSFNGVSACMTKAGKDTSIEFSEPVLMDPDPECNTGKLIRNGTMWIYDMPSGLCQVRFMSKLTGDIHLHYMIGFIDARID